MCSWCWGFRPVWNQVQQVLADKVSIQYVLGGLARDTQQPMPESMRLVIRETWQRIQQEIPGIEFNYDFWSDCQPRRSTYPSCRAVIAAGFQGDDYGKAMLYAIQKAYYLQARNPSNNDVLIQLSAEIGLNANRFETDLFSKSCENVFKNDLQLTSDLGVSAFPSLVLSNKDSNALIHIDYTSSETIVSSVLDGMKVSAEMK
jgi:putative protein-disulfide isomerase